MATSAARPTRKQARPVSKERVAAARESRPFLRFYHSEGLRSKTVAVLDAIERAEDPTRHRGALAEVVLELTKAGMDAYFMKPLKLAKAGFLVEQSAQLGMTGSVKVMSSVVGSIIGRMNAPQLLSVSSSIRELML
ncbi:MAG TPA: hypothetical protein VGR00_07105 [Thermoanaerobaculia bacterium]|jgi:hypothetical protein|nr:hypothetical protein [Thermoanaerobaculia bacterium]